jgi:hypothetical protein
MSIETLKTILGDSEISDEQLTALLERAKKKAVNHHFLQIDDEPSEGELNKFYDRYEYEIYDLVKVMADSDSRDGLKRYVELGVTREWESGGEKSIENALSAIPPKTYVL